MQRFYFPECKAYELDHQGADLQSRKKFWNAVESFGRLYPTNMYNIPNENDDVYQGHDNYPLLPTLKQHLYANRFRGGGKTMYHLYNATGATYEGPVLEVALKPGQHAFELLRGEELPVTQGRVSVYVERDDVACVAVLPQVLTVQREGQTLTLQAKDKKPGQVVVVDEKGEAVLTQELAAGGGQVDLSKLPEGAKAVYVKLLRGGQLVDAAGL